MEGAGSGCRGGGRSGGGGELKEVGGRGGGVVAAGMLGTTNPKSEDFSETLASGACWG